MRKITYVFICLWCLSLLVSKAWAGDAKSSSYSTVWSGAEIKVSDEGKRFNGGLSHLNDADGTRYEVNVSAPLDSDTRIAAFQDNTGRLASGYAMTFSWKKESYKGWVESLMTQESQAKIASLCTEAGENPQACNVNKVYKYYKEKWDYSGMPLSNHLVGSFDTWGVDVSLNFDRLKAYNKGDISLKATENDKYSIKAGGAFTHYFVQSQRAFNARTGIDYSRKISTDKVRRCSSVPSGDASITGESCEDALVFKGDPKQITSGYFYLSLTELYLGLIKDDTGITSAAPGYELAANFDRLGRGAQLELNLLLYVTPTNRTGMPRAGVGLKYWTAVEDDPDKDYKSGDLRFTPYATISSTF